MDNRVDKKGFQLSKNMKAKTLEAKPPRRRYSCSVCLIQPRSSREMRQHVVLVHGANDEVVKKVLMDQKKKPLIKNGPTNGCYVCGELFHCRTITRLHVRWCEQDLGLVLKDDIPTPKELVDLKKPEFQLRRLHKKAKELRKAEQKGATGHGANGLDKEEEEAVCDMLKKNL